MTAFAQPTTDTAAREYLDRIMAMVGVDGLVEALSSPGLLALVDQHAAAVRDSLGDPEAGPNATSLAGYATGLRDALIDSDWQLAPLDEVDWRQADWPTLRLTAICGIARALGYA